MLSDCVSARCLTMIPWPARYSFTSTWFGVWPSNTPKSPIFLQYVDSHCWENIAAHQNMNHPCSVKRRYDSAELRIYYICSLVIHVVLVRNAQAISWIDIEYVKELINLGYFHIKSWFAPSRSWYFIIMMTSSNGNIVRVTGPLCGEFTGHRWIPRTKANDAELWCFLWSAPEWTVE